VEYHWHLLAPISPCLVEGVVEGKPLDSFHLEVEMLVELRAEVWRIRPSVILPASVSGVPMLSE